ncbi:hypothetical protein [Streptomyces sp. NPDC046978]|uniref:TRADD-N-associated membrane domain-containing protein n=1 Tax=Streptomyces sp. NPDC046978 TaxID=3154704 RepID=UPI0033E79E55
MTNDNTSRPKGPSTTRLRILLVGSLMGTLGILLVYQTVTRRSDHAANPVIVGLVLALAATVLVIQRTLHRREQEEALTSRTRLRVAERQFERSLIAPHLVHTSGEPFEIVDGYIERPAPHGVDEEPEVDELPASRDLTLSRLWAVTNARLDLYHEIATRQARQSFRNAQAAMVIGFLLLAAFVTVAFKASTTTGAVVAGGLGAVSAALSGYVSRTFVKSQETAAGHLKAYFDQPLEFARYLTAERLITESGLTEEQRQEAVLALVKGLAASPGGGALQAEASEQQAR